jgi:ADP-ribose pyrophosphatase YjhB (NUDIX family)
LTFVFAWERCVSSFIVNVEAVAWRDGTFLMIERGEEEEYGAGWLSFPGGKVDWNGEEADVLELTARRELQEEVGLDVPGPWHFAESKAFGADENPVVDVVMIARSTTGEPFINSPGEVANIAWMTADQIRNDARTQPWTLASIDRLEQIVSNLGWTMG